MAQRGHLGRIPLHSTFMSAILPSAALDALWPVYELTMHAAEQCCVNATTCSVHGREYHTYYYSILAMVAGAFRLQWEIACRKRS
jgi:hypothetical protein